MPCKHICVNIWKTSQITRWGFTTTQAIKKKTSLTKPRYEHKSLLDILKFAFLVEKVCNDNDIYYNLWLHYNEKKQASITCNSFQQHNIDNYNSTEKLSRISTKQLSRSIVDTKRKFKKSIVTNIWKETRDKLKKWIELVCSITKNITTYIYIYCLLYLYTNKIWIN